MKKNKYKCILCSSKLIKKIHNFGKQPASNNYKTRLYKNEYLHELILCKCANCNLIQIVDPIPINKIRPKYNWIRYREQEAHLDKVARNLTKKFNKNDKIIGITTKDLTFLDRMRIYNFKNVKSFDTKKDYLFESDLPSLETIQSIFNIKFTEKIKKKYGLFDLLVSRHFLEHSRKPLDLLNNFKKIIKPQGSILIEVPDSEKLIKNSNYFFIWEEHMSYFTINTLENMFKYAQLNIIQKFKFHYTHENSLVYLLKPNLMNKAKIIKHNKDKNYNNIFFKKIKSFNNVINKYNKKNIVFLGAGHISIRFINFYKLSNKIKFVIDDDPNKIGKYLPMSNLKIYPSTYLYKHKIDLCISTLNEESEKDFKNNNQQFFKNNIKILNIFK